MLRRLLEFIRRQTGPLHDPVVRRAFFDDLTGLPTRHALLSRLREARQAGLQGSVAMVDIDLFKVFNDRHGRACGDALLVLVAQRLRESLPEGTELARVGGDEFAVFLPTAGVAEAERLLSACLQRVRQPLEAIDLPSEIVTLSAGIASLAGIDDALQACDIAMYAAKARGRDRVVAFDDDTRRIVTARRELACAVIELQQLNRQLRNEARTDALTRLRNRLALDEVLDLKLGDDPLRWAQATVLFIDIDHFGEYNHRHGDAGGDEALRAVAAVVRSSAREADLVFRKGGDELVAIVPDVAGQDAEHVAERVRAAVERLGIAHSGSPVAPVLTVTVGAATGGGDRTLRQLLISAAERAMAAKMSGQRNRVHAVHFLADTHTPPAQPEHRVALEGRPLGMATDPVRKA